MFADGLRQSWLPLCLWFFWPCRFLLTDIMDTTDGQRQIPAVRSVRWKDVRRQGGIPTTDVSTVAMTMREITVTAPV